MASYIVRRAPPEPHARELVGIFVADNVDQLFELVNETETPLCCEYRKLGNGGIYWDSATGRLVPQQNRAGVMDDWVSLPPDPILSTSWEAAFSVGDQSPATDWRVVPAPRWR